MTSTTYLISYDLNRAKDYNALYARLKILAAQRAMDSTWIIPNCSYRPMWLHDFLKQVMDNDDSLIVTSCDVFAASGLETGATTVLKAA